MDTMRQAILREFERWTGKPGDLVAGDNVDLTMEHPDVDGRIVVEMNSSGTRPVVRRALDRLKHATGHPLVVVRSMGPSVADLCAQEGVSWLDAAGNADIHWPGFFVRVEGRPAVSTAKPRRSPFAPKAARVIRVLAWERRAMRQSELAEMAEIDPGYASRVVHGLEAEGLVERAGSLIRVPDLRALLDEWRARYRPAHQRLTGALAERTSRRLVEDVVERLRGDGREVALTGLAGAWLYTQGVAHRRITAYVDALPDPALLTPLGFVPTESAPSLVLELADDDWLWRHTNSDSGLRCADPALVYVDLAREPERSAEATEAMWSWFANRE